MGDIEKHDETVISNWNSTVGKDDTVIHVGDVGLGNEDSLLSVVRRLNGHIHLVTGNHDRVWPGHRDARRHQRKWMEVFESVQAFTKIRISGRTILVSHFPYDGDSTRDERYTQYRFRNEGAWLIHGHIHAATRIDGRQVHVGMDAWDLRPVPVEVLTKLIEEEERKWHMSPSESQKRSES